MSNRGRQNVASYLTLDLGLDWRKVISPLLLGHLHQGCSFQTLILPSWVPNCIPGDDGLCFRIFHVYLSNVKDVMLLQGADWFESVLTDYDVCSNWGNWVSAAGLTGGRVKHFNITKQSKACII